MSCRRLVAIVAAWLVLQASLLLLAPAALAKGEIQAHLDAALPTDAPPGTVVTVGWTIAVLEGDTWTDIDPGNVFIRLVGTDGVTEARATGDGAGHFVARIVVPAGGIGSAWIGSDDTCIGPACARTPDQLFTIGGIGAEPPIVPANELVATIDPFPLLGPPYTEVDVTARLAPRPGVQVAGREMPGSLWIRARDPRTGLATYIEANRIMAWGVYRATLPLPSAGELEIEVGTGSGKGLSQVLARVATPLVVAPAGARKDAAGDAAASAPAASESVAARSVSEAPLALGAVAAAAVVLVGLALARRAPRRSARA